MASEKRLSKDQLRVLAAVNEQQLVLGKLSDQQLLQTVESRRMDFVSKPETQQQAIPEVLAFAQEAVRRTLGWQLYDVQLIAAHALISGQVAEMQTGEGKTLSAVPAAIFGGMMGQGTHIATPTPYLAQRDYQQLRPVYECLGLNVALLQDDAIASSDKRAAYDADITYGPGYEFGFDYLRDQVILQQREAAPLGKNTLAEFVRSDTSAPSLSTRQPHWAIVDEADNVLIDDASSPLVLSEYQPGIAADADAIRLAHKLADSLTRDEDFRDAGWLQIELTEQGKQVVYQDDVPIPVEQLTRPWTTYVETALSARHQFRQDVHYIVDDTTVKIVN